MVPAEIRFLKGFPTTSSGKIDRQNLKALADVPEPASDGTPVSRTETDRRPGDTK
jgi:acyl-coenzyme A synthetase/AMP-(fatty) acid ligase